MRWELQAVMDLTTPSVRNALGIRKTDLTACEWEAEQLRGREPLTQAIARAAFERMAEGLVVPSARDPNGVNVVYFPSHRRENTVLRALDEASIPFLHGL
jgi:RES domain-containing protein